MHLLLASTVTFAAPADLEATLSAYNQHATYPLPELGDRELEALEKGEVVKRLDRPGDPDQPRRATGLVIVEVPRDAIWIAAQDPHLAVDPDLIEKKLSSEGDRAVWYGIIDLPKPLHDRHWLLQVWNNHELAEHTDDRAWEHAWQIIEGGDAQIAPYVAAGDVAGVSVDRLERAIYTRVNHGAWVAVDLGDERTLLGYHVTTVVGGAIPEWLVARLSYAKLEATLRRVEERGRELVPGHYVAGHTPMWGGNGGHIAFAP